MFDECYRDKNIFTLFTNALGVFVYIIIVDNACEKKFYDRWLKMCIHFTTAFICIGSYIFNQIMRMKMNIFEKFL